MVTFSHMARDGHRIIKIRIQLKVLIREREKLNRFHLNACIIKILQMGQQYQKGYQDGTEIDVVLMPTI